MPRAYPISQAARSLLAPRASHPSERPAAISDGSEPQACAQPRHADRSELTWRPSAYLRTAVPAACPIWRSAMGHHGGVPVVPARGTLQVPSGAVVVVGSLATNADPTYAYHSIFGPLYPASRGALNGMTLAMMVELESTGIKVNLVSPAFTETNLNDCGHGVCRGRLPRGGACCAARPRRPDPVRSHVGKTQRSRGDGTCSCLTLRARTDRQTMRRLIWPAISPHRN